jgi:hypothetical protein
MITRFTKKIPPRSHSQVMDYIQKNVPSFSGFSKAQQRRVIDILGDIPVKPISDYEVIPPLPIVLLTPFIPHKIEVPLIIRSDSFFKSKNETIECMFFENVGFIMQHLLYFKKAHREYKGHELVDLDIVKTYSLLRQDIPNLIQLIRDNKRFYLAEEWSIRLLRLLDEETCIALDAKGPRKQYFECVRDEAADPIIKIRTMLQKPTEKVNIATLIKELDLLLYQMLNTFKRKTEFCRLVEQLCACKGITMNKLILNFKHNNSIHLEDFRGILNDHYNKLRTASVAKSAKFEEEFTLLTSANTKLKNAIQLRANDKTRELTRALKIRSEDLIKTPIIREQAIFKEIQTLMMPIMFEMQYCNSIMEFYQKMKHYEQAVLTKHRDSGELIDSLRVLYDCFVSDILNLAKLLRLKVTQIEFAINKEHRDFIRCNLLLSDLKLTTGYDIFDQINIPLILRYYTGSVDYNSALSSIQSSQKTLRQLKLDLNCVICKNELKKAKYYKSQPHLSPNILSKVNADIEKYEKLLAYDYNGNQVKNCEDSKDVYVRAHPIHPIIIHPITTLSYDDKTYTHPSHLVDWFKKC